MNAAASANPLGRGIASKISLVLLIFEGYVYLACTVLVFAAVVAMLAWGVFAQRPALGVLALFVALPAAALTLAAVRALVFRVPEPYGVEVTARDAPALVAMIEDVRRRLGAPRIHRTIIDTRFNASICQVPRLAIFWPRNTLMIGYPLLVALTPEQLRCVIVHELAHVFHSHGRLAGLVYRTRLSWMRLAAALDERGAIPIHVRWVLASYVPRLEARSAEIAREQEFVADRAAAAMTNSRTAADTLVAIEIGDNLVRHTYWPGVLQKVEQQREPPLPFAEMAAAVDNLADDGARAELLASLMQDETECHDTHPSLRDRLQALDELPRVPEAGGRKAGEAYVGPVLREIARRLDEEWQARHRTRWQQRHAELEAAQLRLADLEAQSAKTAEAAFERATLLERLGREDDALAAYRVAVELDHAHGPAALAAGRMLLGIGDDAGAAMVERAMQLDHNLVPEACALLVSHYKDQGRPAEAQRYRTRATRHATRSAIEAEERSAAGPLDRFAPHELAGRELAALTAALGREAEIDGALLARKHFRHSAGSMLVLGLIAGRVDSNDLASRIHGAGLLPSDTHVVVLNRDQRPLQCALEAVHGSRIYGRGASAIVPASS